MKLPGSEWILFPMMYVLVFRPARNVVIATRLCNKILYTSTDMKNYRQNGYKNEAAFQLRFPCPFKFLSQV